MYAACITPIYAFKNGYVYPIYMPFQLWFSLIQVISSVSRWLMPPHTCSIFRGKKAITAYFHLKLEKLLKSISIMECFIPYSNCFFENFPQFYFFTSLVTEQESFPTDENLLTVNKSSYKCKLLLNVIRIMNYGSVMVHFSGNLVSNSAFIPMVLSLSEIEELYFL